MASSLDGGQLRRSSQRKITNVAKQNKKAPGGGIFGLARRPRSYNNNRPSLVDMAACEVLERFRVSTLARAYTVAGGRTSGRIGEKYSKKLPAVSGNSGKCSSIVIVLVFYMFEKCMFEIAYNRSKNLKKLLFPCYLK